MEPRSGAGCQLSDKEFKQRPGTCFGKIQASDTSLQRRTLHGTFA